MLGEGLSFWFVFGMSWGIIEKIKIAKYYRCKKNELFVRLV